MSAATSGFELPLTIIPPTKADLTGIRQGAFLHQKIRLCGSPQEVFSRWFVKSVNGKIQVLPVRGLHLGCLQQGEVRTMTENKLKERFNVHRRAC